MKKIPTVLVRDPNDRVHVLDEVTPGCLWVLAGEGTPTRKYDGTISQSERLKVMILATALVRIQGERQQQGSAYCESFTRGSCRDDSSGRQIDATYSAFGWCDACIASEALERVGLA